MPRKGKEPAGLRRYRLAQKRKKKGGRTRRVRRVKRRPTMARRRYGRKRRGGKKSRAIPLAIVLPPAAIVVKDVQLGGGVYSVANRITEDFTGYNMDNGKWSFDQVKPLLMAEVVGVVAHKVAGKIGLNRQMKKLTMGYLEI